MAKRSPFTREELILCIYAARYGVQDIGGVATINGLRRRPLASIKMKIQNIVAMCAEEGLFHAADIRPLTGKPPGLVGRRTNWDLVAELSHLSREQHLQLCNGIIASEKTWPDELNSGHAFIEGSVRSVLVNAYERDASARRRCIEYYGESCIVCCFNFFDFYGADAAGFIQVHHLVPLSLIGRSYRVDPIKDLRPICANCHAVVHLGGITRSIEDVRQMVKSNT